MLEIAKKAARFFINFSSKLSNSRLFYVSKSCRPFENLENINSDLYSEVLKVINEYNTVFKNETDSFLAKLKDWDELESYIKAKMPKPVEPIPNLVFFLGHSVTSVDRMVDQKKIFLTCEIPGI